MEFFFQNFAFPYNRKAENLIVDHQISVTLIREKYKAGNTLEAEASQGAVRQSLLG